MRINSSDTTFPSNWFLLHDFESNSLEFETSLKQIMGFFKLPAELRNDIYELVLVDPDCMFFSNQSSRIVVSSDNRIIKSTRRGPKEPGLLLVNRQIRNEAFSIFWGSNTFLFDGSTMMELWLNRLQPDKLTALRAVQVSADARIWSMHIVQAKKDLQDLYDSLRSKGLRQDAVELPMQVEGEGEIWISLSNIDGFERSAKAGFVIQKATKQQR